MRCMLREIINAHHSYNAQTLRYKKVKQVQWTLQIIELEHADNMPIDFKGEYLIRLRT